LRQDHRLCSHALDLLAQACAGVAAIGHDPGRYSW
jgi:hypothetical protein